MRPFVIELFTEVIELALLRVEVPGRRPGRLCLQRAMHTRMATILLRLARFDQLGQYPQAEPSQADNVESRASVAVANGTPLSVRMRRGRPYSLEQPGKHRLGTGYRCG